MLLHVLYGQHRIDACCSCGMLRPKDFDDRLGLHALIRIADSDDAG